MGAFDGERAVVIGLGVSGRAAARVLLEEGADVTVSEVRPASELEVPDDLDAVALHAGGHRDEHLDGASLVVASPGVPESSPIVRRALEIGLPVWSELELGARLCTAPYLAVTGTNGKTTTTEMLAACLRAAGLDAVACGNIGLPFSIAAREGHEALAVEASSFQLRFHESLSPRVSVLLNLAPDHLDWHGTLDSYAAAKSRVFANQAGDDVHVGNADDPAAARVSDAAPCRVVWFRSAAPSEGEVGFEDDELVSRLGEEAHLGSCRGMPSGVRADAAAASAAALAFGLEAGSVAMGLAAVPELPHRGEVVAHVDGVSFVDDSKATNPHAALASLEGREGVVLIAGGLTKGVDLRPLASAARTLSGVVAIGEARGELVRVFDGVARTRTAETMEEAVRTAMDMSSAGGTVLLAPACASQDMFRDYAERGERFAAAARALERQAVGRG
jgi:UDP-N-acetylmuramoylalanine--D-glutamate ligase